jgi:hypothetical protein
MLEALLKVANHRKMGRSNFGTEGINLSGLGAFSMGCAAGSHAPSLIRREQQDKGGRQIGEDSSILRLGAQVVFVEFFNQGGALQIEQTGRL